MRCCARDGRWMAFRRRPAGAGAKPPCAALAEDRRGERQGKGARDASGGGQGDVPERPFAGVVVEASLTVKVASKPGGRTTPGMSLAGTRLLAKRCPA